MKTKSLSKELREGTKKAHNVVENVSFIANYLQGVINRDSYIKMLSDFYHVYSKLEECLEAHKDHVVLKHVYYPELYRTESIEKDLKYFLGDEWKSKLSQTAACKTYVSRLSDISELVPYCLISHQYTRYIGDLSGGLILKEITKVSLGLGEEGLNFYNFDQIPYPTEFKNNYRKSLDYLDITDTDIEIIVDQAVKAFELNTAMFIELGVNGNLLNSIVNRFGSLFGK